MKVKSIQIESEFESWDEVCTALKLRKNVKLKYHFVALGEFIDEDLFLDNDDETIYYIHDDWERGRKEKRTIGKISKADRDLDHFVLIETK